MACEILRAGKAVDDCVIILGLYFRCLDDAVDNGTGCYLAMIDACQDRQTVHFCQYLVMLTRLVFTVDDWC